MVPANRRYVIFDASEVNTIDFTQVLQTSAETLRLSIDETKALIKYEPSPAQDEVLYVEGDPELDEDSDVYNSDASIGDVKIEARTGDEVPSSVEALTSKSQGYTHSEILEILNGEEWTPEIPEEMQPLESVEAPSV